MLVLVPEVHQVHHRLSQHHHQQEGLQPLAQQEGQELYRRVEVARGSHRHIAHPMVAHPMVLLHHRRRQRLLLLRPRPYRTSTREKSLSPGTKSMRTWWCTGHRTHGC